MLRRATWLVFAVLGLLLAALQRTEAQSIFEFSASQSKLEMDVYKEGFFKAFGHDHLVGAREFSGRVVVDETRMEKSSVTLRVSAKSLTVMDPDASPKDRKEIQDTMQGETVLDAAKFPEIVFTSTGVGGIGGKAGAWRLTVEGTLKLHGTERKISFPLKLSLNGGQLAAEGELRLRQTDFGITPIKVGGGSVKVKDELRIRFEVRAGMSKP